MGNTDSQDPKALNSSLQDRVETALRKKFKPLEFLKYDDTKIQASCQKPIVLNKKHNSLKINIHAKPVRESSENGIILKKINPGKDGRTQITDTEKWPYSAHGIVFAKFPDQTSDCISWGSAVMISENLVLTAAHNIYDLKKHQEAIRVRYMPAMTGKLMPYGEAKVKKWYFPEEYKKYGNEDYALIVLEGFTGEETGYFGLNWSEDATALQKEIIHVTGYPEDKIQGKHEQYEMWEMTGPISSINDGYIEYQIDVSSGQNGGGVWYEKNGEYYIIGIHVKGNEADLKNEAILLTKRRIEQIESWIHDVSNYVKIEEICQYTKILEIDFHMSKTDCQELREKKLLRLRQISLKLKEQGGIEVLSKANWPQLRSLLMRCYRIDENEVEMLSQANFPELQNLNLDNQNLNARGVEFLSKANWNNLQHLSLENNNIDEKALEFLVMPKWPELQSLNLSKNRVGTKGIELFVKANWPKLKVLNLSLCELRETEAALLAKANWPQLQSLDLSCNLISDKGTEFLAKANWPQLESLNLLENEVGEKGSDYLASAKWPQLKFLNLKANKIKLKGVEILSKAKWPLLRSLSLGKNNVGEKGAEYLAKANWPQLRVLELEQSDIGEKAAELLAKADWPQLRELNLGFNEIGEKGAVFLSKGNWPNLNKMVLTQSKIGEKGAHFLRKSHSVMDFNLNY